MEESLVRLECRYACYTAWVRILNHGKRSDGHVPSVEEPHRGPVRSVWVLGQWATGQVRGHNSNNALWPFSPLLHNHSVAKNGRGKILIITALKRWRVDN